MLRDSQVLLTGAVIAVVGIGSFVVMGQRDQIGQQQRALDQQSLQANAVQQQNGIADQLRNQEAEFTQQLRVLDARQANQANSAQRALEREQLIVQIQGLKAQRAKLDRQAGCNQTQMGIQAAERSGDTNQVKVLQDRWNANCAG